MRTSRRTTLITVLTLHLASIAVADQLSSRIHWHRIGGPVSEDLFSMNLFAFPSIDKVASPRYRQNVHPALPAGFAMM